MSRPSTKTSMLLASCAALGAAVSAGQVPPGFLERLDVRLVNVEVYVTDRQGNPVEGLTAKDFTLLEDGKKQKISNFSYVGRLTEAQEAPEHEPLTEPARIVLFFDNFAIQPQGRRLVLEDLRRTLESGELDNTSFAVASYEGYLRMHQTFTTDREAILAAIEESGRLTSLGVLRQAERDAIIQQGLETLREVVQITTPADQRDPVLHLRAYVQQVRAEAERQRQQKQIAVFAMSHLVNGLAPLPGRKAVVYIGEGMPMQPGEELWAAVDQLMNTLRADLVNYEASTSSEGRDASIDMRSNALGALDPGSRSIRQRGQGSSSGIQDLTALANTGRVSFYTLKADVGEGVEPAKVTGSIRELAHPQLIGVHERNLSATLSAMADETGGRKTLGTGIGELVAQAKADLGSYYYLGFQPKRDADGAFHKLKVKLKGRGVNVRHRQGYVDKPPLAKVADRTTASLLLAHDENALGIELLFGPPTDGPKDGIKAVPVIVSIPLGFLDGLPASMQSVPAAVYIAARDPEGRTAPVQQLPIELDRASEGGRHTTGFRLLLREGDQRLAIGLVVPAAGASAFVSSDLQIRGEVGG